MGQYEMASANAAEPADTGITAPASGPVPPTERIDSIDVLRGLALFGVLTINVVFEFRVSIFQQFLPSNATEPVTEHAFRLFLAAALELKAFALFSLLFGVGLAIQFQRLAANPRRPVLQLRRLIVLLAIGAVHMVLLWNGDILVEYAVAGLVVLPILFGPRWLVGLAAAATLLLYLAMPMLPPVVDFPSSVWIRSHVAEARQIYGGGGFLDVLAFRIREIPALLPLHLAIFPRTVALFLFGVLAWRSKILRNAGDHRRLSVPAGHRWTAARRGPNPRDRVAVALADVWRMAADWPEPGLSRHAQFG